MVENIHMKERMMAVAFSIKNREAKDKYKIDSNFRNTLSELSSDLINYGSDIVLRKSLISSIALRLHKISVLITAQQQSSSITICERMRHKHMKALLRLLMASIKE